ncbi:unnamed protein product [Owenia fusiformis]|uniref:Uncharacterized protein n=1 Tax=Owenia fusiformis TaxID=6347 RepID=A0A8S4N7M0_OWEFU|nr:unnamed protein product [Owenia fusiformis]
MIQEFIHICLSCYSALKKFKYYNRQVDSTLKENIQSTNNKWICSKDCTIDNSWICQIYKINKAPIGRKRKVSEITTEDELSFNESDLKRKQYLCSTPKKQCIQPAETLMDTKSPSEGTNLTPTPVVTPQMKLSAIQLIMNETNSAKPLSRWEEKLFTHLAKIKLAQAEERGKVKCQNTRGQVLIHYLTF